MFGRDSLDGRLHYPRFGHYRFAQIAVIHDGRPGQLAGSPATIREARDHLERGLFQPGSNDDLAFLDAHKKRAIAAQV